MRRGLHWFRNDLRLRDNSALCELAGAADEWLPVFVLDPRLAPDLRRATPRLRFLLDCLTHLRRDLARRGVPLLLRRGRPEEQLPRLLRETGAELLSFNSDVSPFARRRDGAVRRAAERQGVRVLELRDRVVFDSGQVHKPAGGIYSVYAPFRRAWWRRFEEEGPAPLRAPRLPPPIPGFRADSVPAVRAQGVGAASRSLPPTGEAAARRRLARFLERSVGRYSQARELPALDGTSRLSPHLRFGTLSIRDCIARAREAAAAEPGLRCGVGRWLDELLWREFYAAILQQEPRVLATSYRREYDRLIWNDDAAGFAAWCEGRTGYPIVDAGMRQLAGSGWMHNRVRMIVASFLTKDLLIDWREGERFFFRMLVDGEPASNNGGWQWAASTGTDAQPFFRIFNPVSQGLRHDPEGAYVRRWVPELRDLDDRFIHAPWEAPVAPSDYPAPIVDHGARRIAALERYREARRASADPLRRGTRRA